MRGYNKCEEGGDHCRKRSAVMRICGHDTVRTSKRYRACNIGIPVTSMSTTPRDEDEVGHSKDKLADTSNEENLWVAESVHRK